MESSFTIAYCFADVGVEAEALAAYGEVHRYTIDPRANAFTTETTAMDLLEATPAIDADLALLHPKCTKWSDMPDVEPDEHENQIPRARELGHAIADDYIIENKPRAPLEDPTLLSGKMFGLPIAYERAFETTFRVPTPPHERSLPTDCSPYFYSDRTFEWWKSVKGYQGSYPKHHLAKNALPAAYLHFLIRAWLEAQETRDAEQAQDNNSRAPPTCSAEQATLSDL